MAAEAITGRFRPASAAAGRVALAAAALTVAMFGACGVLLLLTRDYQRAAYGAAGPRRPWSAWRWVLSWPGASPPARSGGCCSAGRC